MRCAEAPVRCETISRPALSQVPRYVRVVSSTLSCKVLHYRPSDHRLFDSESRFRDWVGTPPIALKALTCAPVQSASPSDQRASA
jgi:hypothetical protein